MEEHIKISQCILNNTGPYKYTKITTYYNINRQCIRSDSSFQNKPEPIKLVLLNPIQSLVGACELIHF